MISPHFESVESKNRVRKDRLTAGGMGSRATITSQDIRECPAGKTAYGGKDGEQSNHYQPRYKGNVHQEKPPTAGGTGSKATITNRDIKGMSVRKDRLRREEQGAERPLPAEI